MRKALIAALLALSCGDVLAQRAVLSALDLVTMDRVSDPQMAPDGQRVAYSLRRTDLEADRGLYFLSTRSGSSQVWRLPAGGGEAQPVTRLPVDVGAFVLAPGGVRIALSLQVFADCAADLDCTATRLEAPQRSAGAGQLHTQLFVLHWDRWTVPTP